MKKTVKVAKAVKPVEKPVTVKPTKVVCNDTYCHIHGHNKTRGRVFEGIIIKSKMAKTVTVEWARKHYLSKYERFEKRRSRVKAHNAPCINAKVGDKVRIAECRAISKTKNFTIIEVISNEGN